MFEENGLAAGAVNAPAAEKDTSDARRELVADRITLAQAFGQLPVAPESGIGNQGSPALDLEKAIVIKVEGVKVLRLPAGTSLEDVKIVDDDLVLVQKDGAPPIVLDGGAKYLPDITIGDVEIPRAVLAAAFEKAGIEPAAGPETADSAGSDGSQNVPDIGPFLGISPLLPPTELSFPTLEQREIAPGGFTAEIEPPTVEIISGLTGDQLLVKEDGAASVTLQATAAAGSDDVIVSASITGLNPNAVYVIGGQTVTGQTAYTLVFSGQNQVETFTIEVQSAQDDADADLGSISVVATAGDPIDPSLSAVSNQVDIPVIVDAVLDQVATPDQATAASATEQTTQQVVGLGLSLSFADTAYPAPANQPYDGTAGDASETFTVTITVNSDALNLQLSSAFTGNPANAGITLTETAPGVWTLSGTTGANVASAVAAVQAIVPANYDGSVTGSIQVVSTDTAPGGVEVDLTDNSQTTSDTWALNIAPDVDPPTVTVTAGLTDGQLIVKEDGTATVSLLASAAAGTDDLVTSASITGLSATAQYVINGTTVTGQTSYNLVFSGTNASEAITIQVISQVDDADADLGTIQVVATAKDGNNPAVTADSSTASVPVIVDAVLDQVATPDQATAASANELTSQQVVGLGLSLSFADTAYPAPANQPNDTTAGDASETFTVTITVNSDAVNLQLSSAFTGNPANAGITLTEGSAGVWTLSGTTAANVAAAVAAVQAIVPANYDGTVTGSIQVVSTDTAPGGVEVDLTDNSQTTSDTWTLNIAPDVDPPTVTVTAGLTDGHLIVKEDGTATVSLLASAAAGTDDLVTSASITGLSATAQYVINGTTVTGQTSYNLVFSGTNASEAITIQVISQVDDADADLGTIQVVATAKDGNNPSVTADSTTASVPVIVDAVLDQVATPDQATAASASEQTSQQLVGLGLSLSFANTAYPAPSNQPYDTTAGDASETFTVTITVTSDTVNLQLSSAFATLNPLVTLTEGAPGVWTLNGTTSANVAAAVAAVQAIVPANYDGTVTGSIQVVSTDTAPGGVEVDLTDNSQTKSDTWTLNVTPDVDPPTVTVTAGLTDGQLIVKEDGTATVSLLASAAAGTDDLVTSASITGLSATAQYVINGTTVTGQTSYNLVFSGTNASEAITIQVISQVDDADADLGTIQVVATAKDGNNPSATANSNTASVPVIVDAVLDQVATPDQVSAATANEQTSQQLVGLGLSLSFANTAYPAPSNQPYDTTAGDASETFTVTITVNSDAVNLQLSSAFAAANPLVTLTEGAPGVWTLNGTTSANVSAAVAAVQAIVPANYDGSVTGSIQVVSTDTAPGGVEVDLTDNSQTKSDTWALNIAPDVDPPTVTVTAGLTNGQLIVKEDGTATVSLLASAAAGTDDLVTSASITGLNATAQYVINGTTVTGQTSYNLVFSGTNASEAITIQVISQVDDADADLGTIQVVATAKDGNNPAVTADSNTASVPVIVDAVLDQVATPDQATAASANEQTSQQLVGLGLSLSFANTAYPAPANQPYDTTAGDASETFTVTITVTSDTVNLQLSSAFATLNPLVTLTEGAPGVWTLNGTTSANVAAAVAAVQAIVPANYDGTVTGSIQVVSTDTAPGGVEVDLTDNSQTKSDTWTLNVAPDVDPPTVTVTAGLTNGQLIVKEDGTATVSLLASVAPGTDDVLTGASITGLSATAQYVINGVTVTGQTTYNLALSGTSQAITIQVISQVDDADADLGTIQVVATAKDGNNPAVTADSTTASVPVIVDAVLDQVATPDQASPVTANELTTQQVVGLGLSLSFANTAYPAPANQPYDTTAGDASETFTVTITVNGDAVNLQLSAAFAAANPLVTLTEGAAGVWTLNGTTSANVSAAVAAVQAVVPANYDAPVTGSIQVVSTDTAPGGVEVDLTDNSQTKSDTWSLSFNDSGIGVAGSVSLTVYETALDKNKDGSDLAAGDVTGNNPGLTTETAQSGVGNQLTFTAGGDPITSIAFAAPTGVNAPTVSGLAAGYTLTWAIVGNQLVGSLIGPGSVNYGPAVYVGLSGQLTASEGQSISPTVTVTLADRLEHLDASGINSLTISNIVVVATDSDGSTANGQVSVTVVDDVPNPFTPVEAYFENLNETLQTFEGSINFAPNAGADGVDSVKYTFNIGAGGSQLLDSSGNVITHDGLPIILNYTDATKTQIVGMADGQEVFVATLNPDDTYTIEFTGIFKAGQEFDLNDFVQIGGGNNTAVAYDGLVDNQDLLVTGTASWNVTNPTFSTVNTSSGRFGIGSGQSLTSADAIRFDFVINAVQSGSTAYGYDYDTHYEAGSFKQQVTRVQGSSNANAEMTIIALNADDDNYFFKDNGNPVAEGAAETTEAITMVKIYNASGVLIGTATSDGTVGGVGVNFLRAGDGDVDSLTKPLGSVTLTNMKEGYYFEVFTDATFSAIMVTGGSQNNFTLGGLSFTTESPQEPIDFVLPIIGYDGDGDSASSQIAVHLYPDDMTFTTSIEGGTVTGTSGDDFVLGIGGNETLNAGTGNDLLIGGEGADNLNGDGGIDTASYASSSAAVNVNLTSNINTGGDAQGDLLSQIENLIGSSFDDTLTGDGLANRLDGGGGNDVLSGLGGADLLNGGAGNDTLNGGLGADILNGGDGNDVLVGGDGIDTLTGGLGADRFVLGSSELGVPDLIVDYNASEGDVIDLTGLVSTPTGVDPETAGFVDYNPLNGAVMVDANGGGDNYVQVATIQNFATVSTINILYHDQGTGTAAETNVG